MRRRALAPRLRTAPVVVFAAAVLAAVVLAGLARAAVSDLLRAPRQKPALARRG